MTRTQQRKGVESSSTASEQRSQVTNYNPIFELDDLSLQEDASIHNFDGRKASYMANAMEQALLLLRDIDELRNLRKLKFSCP